jgi:hypothetical protein
MICSTNLGWRLRCSEDSQSCAKGISLTKRLLTSFFNEEDANIAQSVEHFHGKEKVIGSNPIVGSRNFNSPKGKFLTPVNLWLPPPLQGRIRLVLPMAILKITPTRPCFCLWRHGACRYFCLVGSLVGKLRLLMLE